MDEPWAFPKTTIYCRVSLDMVLVLADTWKVLVLLLICLSRFFSYNRVGHPVQLPGAETPSPQISRRRDRSPPWDLLPVSGADVSDVSESVAVRAVTLRSSRKKRFDCALV